MFYYEIKGLREEACYIANSAFNESMKVLDDLEKSKAKDTLLIISLFKEILIYGIIKWMKKKKIKQNQINILFNKF